MKIQIMLAVTLVLVSVTASRALTCAELKAYAVGRTSESLETEAKGKGANSAQIKWGKSCLKARKPRR